MEKLRPQASQDQQQSYYQAAAWMPLARHVVTQQESRLCSSTSQILIW